MSEHGPSILLPGVVTLWWNQRAKRCARRPMRLTRGAASVYGVSVGRPVSSLPLQPSKGGHGPTWGLLVSALPKSLSLGNILGTFLIAKTSGRLIRVLVQSRSQEKMLRTRAKMCHLEDVSISPMWHAANVTRSETESFIRLAKEKSKQKAGRRRERLRWQLTASRW